MVVNWIARAPVAIEAVHTSAMTSAAVSRASRMEARLVMLFSPFQTPGCAECQAIPFSFSSPACPLQLAQFSVAGLDFSISSGNRDAIRGQSGKPGQEINANVVRS
jgi:hypothetical protein